MDIYINSNIETRDNFDYYGNLFGNFSPVFPYRSHFTLHWQLYKETPDAGNSPDLSSWVKADYTGCGAQVICDNDFVHRVDGALSSEINSGDTIDRIYVVMENASALPASGYVTIFDNSGGHVDLIYDSLELADEKNVVLHIAQWNPQKNFSEGSIVRVSQEAYFSSNYDAEKSDPANGLFVFDCVVYSRKLANVGDKATSRFIDIQGIELLPFKFNEQNKLYELPSFLCDTAAISVNLGEAAVNPELTDSNKNDMAMFIQTYISGGMDIELYNSVSGSWENYDPEEKYSSDYTKFRYWLTSAGENATKTEVPLIQGIQGEPGDKGDKGDKGDPGKDAVSPEITAEITDTGLVLNITDVNGTQNFTLEGFYPRAGVIGVDDNGESVVNILGFETTTTNSFVDGTEPITTAYTFNAPDVVVDDDPDIVFRLPLKSTANPTLGSSVSHTDFIFESYNGKTCASFDGSQYGQYKTTRVHPQGHYTLFMNLAVQSIDSTTQADLEILAVLRNGFKYDHEYDTQAYAQSVKIGVMRAAESGDLYLRATNGAGHLDGSDADTLLERNQFYNVAMTFDGTQTKWFLNGSLIGSEENGLGRDADGSFNLCCLPEKYLGWSADFGMTFLINNIVEYAVALSDERIGELAAQYLNA